MEEADEDGSTNAVKETTEGDWYKDGTITVQETSEEIQFLSQNCKVLNSKVWRNKFNNVEEVIMKKQLSSAKAIYDQYCKMAIFQDTSFKQTTEGYLQIVRYAATFFLVHLTPLLKQWQNMFELSSGDNDKR